MIVDLVYQKRFHEKSRWNRCVGLYMKPWIGEDEATKFAERVRSHLNAVEQVGLLPFLLRHCDRPSCQAKHGAVTTVSDEDGELLCDTLFSLAYGALLLLSHTSLRLFRGRRYGILGANGSGKSTLMRQLRDGKVENFPPLDQVRCVMVEHSLQGEDTALSVLEFVASGRLFAECITRSIGSLIQTNRSRMCQGRRSGANSLRLASMMRGRPTSSADFQGVGR